MPLSITAQDCDGPVDILSVPRPLRRYLTDVPLGAGVIALLNRGGSAANRYHILIVDRIGLDDVEILDPVHCKIVTLTHPGLALTRDFQIGRISSSHDQTGEDRLGIAAQLSLKFLRTDMGDGSYRSDAVAYVYLDHATGDAAFELWSIDDPRRVRR
ncbi:hypothetical protein ACN2XU_00810 [Primorskyibacter sp. 2E107]|uniref:hypothetical protein n=1 Tax=Primorskyibacter sp. 2E107 TaxID=3403458 RepID=UPI003AF95819